MNVPGLIQFRIRKDGSEIAYRAHASLSPSDIAGLISTQAMPMALQLRGFTVLHACAVKIGGKAALFLVPQGQGKSTLAAAFLAAGYSVLSDDVVPLLFTHGKPRVIPAAPEIRLFASTAKRVLPRKWLANSTPVLHKRRITLDRKSHVSRPLEVSCIFLLETSAKLKIEELSGASALSGALRSCFRLDIGNPRLLRGELESLARLVEEVPAYRLRYPRGLAKLETMVRGIARKIKDEQSAD
jgi:hypothetical protein